MQFGGIVGQVELVDVVTKCTSPWFVGPYGWVLESPRALPFLPTRGQLRLFSVEISDLASIMVPDEP
jgi:hypothetical protein